MSSHSHSLNTLRVCAVTVNQTPLDWDGNTKRIIASLEEARVKGAELVCFPELCITGYSCEDMFLSLHTFRMAEAQLEKLLPHTKSLLAVFGMPVFHDGFMYNCAVLVRDGEILGINPKKLLPREGIHYEGRWFQPGRFMQKEKAVLLGKPRPFGDFRYQVAGFSLAVEICEEAWRSDSAATSHALAGVEVVVNPSASHFAFSKYGVRETMVVNNSRSMQVHYIHTNLVGLESGRIIYDGGAMIAECGKMVARGPRFGFKDSYTTYYDLDLDRARIGKLRNRSERVESKVASDSLVVSSPKPFAKSKKPVLEAIASIHSEAKKGVFQLSKEEEFLAAQMLGLFDYWRKSHSNGFVLSLSGGCDSSSIGVLIGHMVASALKELGPENLADRVPLKAMDKKKGLSGSVKDWMKHVLTTVYQSTDNSGPVTKKAALALSTELSSEHIEVQVQDVVDAYMEKASHALSRTLSWQQDDISLQNIQARARAPMVWLIANLKGALLLATSNRSEVAVGYATMDGDTAGGLAPLGGIDKDYLRQWLIWAEKECLWGMGPLKSLSLVNEQAPTAELRPKSEQQKDEEDLMPYDILTQIEKLLVKELMSPKDILALLAREHPSLSKDQLKTYLERFLQLFSYNQWKRERYAPSFLLDEASLDPKTWCRYPILSGAFKDEIKELGD